MANLKAEKKALATFIERQLKIGCEELMRRLNANLDDDAMDVSRPDDSNIQVRIKTPRGPVYYLIRITAPT